MKPETLIYEKIREIIPAKSEKTIFFSAISETSYEMFFYAFIDGKAKQCFELAEEGELDGNTLDRVFEEIIQIIKKSKRFIVDKYNVATIIIDKSRIDLDVEYYDKDIRMYKVKKEWKKKNIG